jgi:CheY-like chemotaxis protein
VIRNFLLADDDADDTALFCEALTQVGPQLNCRTVENGRQLFTLLSSHEAYVADVIFLDINMPIMDGWECLKALRNDRKYLDIPVIIYSTSYMRRDVEKAYALGATLFITKPENFNELCLILKIIGSTSANLSASTLADFACVKMP